MRFLGGFAGATLAGLALLGMYSGGVLGALTGLSLSAAALVFGVLASAAPGGAWKAYKAARRDAALELVSDYASKYSAVATGAREAALQGDLPAVIDSLGIDEAHARIVIDRAFISRGLPKPRFVS